MLDKINHAITDQVAKDAFGPREIGFTIPERYNASEILFRNLEAGRDEKIAVYSLQGNTSYGELCVQAARAGNALKSLGLSQGDRVLLFLNDTTAYPAVFFGAVRAGFVPMLINTLSPKDLIRFYLQDSAAPAAVVDAEYAAMFDEETVAGTPLRSLIVVNGNPLSEPSCLKVLNGDQWFLGLPPHLRTPRISGYRGRPEVIGARSKRRDWYGKVIETRGDEAWARLVGKKKA
jgi:AMP-binding enzyme